MGLYNNSLTKIITPRISTYGLDQYINVYITRLVIIVVVSKPCWLLNYPFIISIYVSSKVCTVT